MGATTAGLKSEWGAFFLGLCCGPLGLIYLGWRGFLLGGIYDAIAMTALTLMGAYSGGPAAPNALKQEFGSTVLVALLVRGGVGLFLANAHNAKLRRDAK